MTDVAPAFLSPAQVADTFGISEFSVGQFVRAGEWPHFRIGRKVWFTVAHVEQIAALSERKPNGPTIESGHGQKTRGTKTS